MYVTSAISTQIIDRPVSQILQSQGKYQVQPPHPFTLGSEFAGKVARNSPIPEGCPYKPGDRVFGATQGSYADQVAVNWDMLIPLPKTTSFDEGAGVYEHVKEQLSSGFVLTNFVGLFITWPTSYEALVGRAELKAGWHILLI